MITPDEADSIATAFREQFQCEGNFERSWRAYFEKVGGKNFTAGGLTMWLQNDQMRDAAEARGVIREPLLPVRSSYETSECGRCRGARYLRRDLPVTHADFGKVVPCPDCNS